MYINISQDPPTNVFETKRKYLRILPLLLAPIFCAILLAVFLVFFDSAHATLIENIALTIFVGPGLLFFYFAEKLHDYKTLSAKEAKEVEEFCRQDHDISAYCVKVSLLKRELIKAEYDAFKSRIAEL